MHYKIVSTVKVVTFLMCCSGFLIGFMSLLRAIFVCG